MEPEIQKSEISIMPRYKKYDYSQSVLIPVEFSKQILPGSIEYVINYMVEKKLNLRELGDSVKYLNISR